MLQARFNLEELTRRADAVAYVVAAEQLFGWRTRSIVVPPGWTAFVTRRERDPLVVSAGRAFEDDDALDVLWVRTTPIACVAEERGLRSSDGHEFCGTLRVSVRVLPQAAELAAFRKTLVGSGEAVSIEDVERYLHWQMQRVVTELAGGHDAERLSRALDAAMVRALVEEKLGAACLTAGLAMDGAIDARFESPAYLDHRRQSADLARLRERQEARLQIQSALAAAQNERLTGLVTKLEQMREAAVEYGTLTMAELIRLFGEAERSQMYAALWHLGAGAKRTRCVAVVSGEEVLEFEPDRIEAPAQRFALPASLGALRSVSVDLCSLEAGVMLVGAATGVHQVRIDTGSVVSSHEAPVPRGLPITGGFNAASMADHQLYATHSQLGLIVWDTGEGGGSPGEPLRKDLTASAGAVRAAHVAEGHVWFTVDEKVYAIPLDDAEGARADCYTGGHAPITALTITGGAVYAGDADGRIIAWDIGEAGSARTVRGQTGGPVESIDVVDAGGVDRLVIADRQNAVLTLVLNDLYTRRYEAGAHRVRRAAAAEDLIVAMNDNRDRLLAWDPRDPSEPSAVTIIPHLTANTIQDLCLIPNM